MLRILFVMDPMDTVAVDKDTTFVFMAEAQRRGHAIAHCEPRDLEHRGGEVAARCRPVTVQPVPGDPARFEATEVRAIGDFDAVFMRKDPPFDIAYVYATHLLELAPRRTLVLNRPDSLRSANEKLYSLRFPEVIPPSVVSASKDTIRAFVLEQGGEAVIKPLDGAGGEGIYLLRADDPNFNVIVEGLTAHGRRWALTQRYLPAIRTTGDVRIVMLDGVPLGAVARVPPPGDLRGNIHVGGSVRRHTLSPREQAICEAVAPSLRADGLWFVGLDVIGDHLTEVNVTSPTGIQEINRLDGVQLERDVLDFVEARCAEPR